jgi:predicted RNA-binding Zn-ribbon protein involved in translation (DUF1610 family)
MAEEKKLACARCGKETGVYTMTTLYHCQNCDTNICFDCLPDECKKGRFFKKYFCPQCGERMSYIERV